MAGKCYTPEQIVSVLRQVEVLVANGKAAEQGSRDRIANVLPLKLGVQWSEGRLGEAI